MVTLGELTGHTRAADRCRKVGHATHGKAAAALRSLLRRAIARPADGTLHVYRCPRCQQWHVGHARRGEGEGC